MRIWLNVLFVDIIVMCRVEMIFVRGGLYIILVFCGLCVYLWEGEVYISIMGFLYFSCFEYLFRVFGNGVGG